ncbi:MAG TPA: hypothetical protein VLL54_14615 [Pyrinomonadaceae bacterium]|nr:hypothetical protein [Pyrinomonadaceae bacterium]
MNQIFLRLKAQVDPVCGVMFMSNSRRYVPSARPRHSIVLRMYTSGLL